MYFNDIEHISIRFPFITVTHKRGNRWSFTAFEFDPNLNPYREKEDCSVVECCESCFYMTDEHLDPKLVYCFHRQEWMMKYQKCGAYRNHLDF